MASPSIDPEVKKTLVRGYYSKYTGKKYNSTKTRNNADRLWKLKYSKANPDEMDKRFSWVDQDWSKHEKYSDKYGRKDGGAYNLETARVNYKSDWTGPDHEGADDNPNFRKVWSALTTHDVFDKTTGKKTGTDDLGGISKSEYSHFKSFLVKNKLGGTKLANMTTAEANKIIGVINDYKAQAEKMGKKWDKNSYKSNFINDVAKGLSKTDKYQWLDTKVPTVITKGKDGDKFFDYNDNFTKGFADLDEDTAQEFESKYIDEVFGTDKGKVGTEGFGKLQQGKTTPKWGVDLVRVDSDFEVGSTKQYEHLTRGKIDWAHYRTDKWFNKAAKFLNVKAGDITGKGDHTDQIQDIRKVNALLNRTSDPSKTDWGKWTYDDWKYELTGKEFQIDDKGVLWKGDPKDGGERQVSFNELTDPKSKFYLTPGQTKTFGKDGELGVTKDGVNITREYKSPVADMDDWVYETPTDDTKDHKTPSGITVEGKVKKNIEDIKRPNIKGIKWDGATPKLTAPAKMSTAPTITPIGTTTWSTKAKTTTAKK